jgi:hypothetical protein
MMPGAAYRNGLFGQPVGKESNPMKSFERSVPKATLTATMDSNKFDRLREIHIANPCHEDWDAMEGDAKKRFCASCSCFVHNIGEMTPTEAEAALNQTGRVCTRVVVDPAKGVLTKAGWVNRLLVAGAVAVTVAGCSTGPEATNDPTVGRLAAPGWENPVAAQPQGSPDTPTMGKPVASKPMMGDVAVGAMMPNPAKPQPLMGTPPPPSKK